MCQEWLCSQDVKKINICSVNDATYIQTQRSDVPYLITKITDIKVTKVWIFKRVQLAYQFTQTGGRITNDKKPSRFFIDAHCFIILDVCNLFCKIYYYQFAPKKEIIVSKIFIDRRNREWRV